LKLEKLKALRAASEGDEYFLQVGFSVAYVLRCQHAKVIHYTHVTCYCVDDAWRPQLSEVDAVFEEVTQ
jgi:hypothetical protein